MKFSTLLLLSTSLSSYFVQAQSNTIAKKEQIENEFSLITEEA